MKVSGFTFVRNAIKYDYPVVESITSILPLCDEFIIAVGKSDDGTRSLIEDIGSPKIRIIETIWDEKLRTGGKILAEQTDIALSFATGDWCFYLQADEVVHEKYLPAIKQAMEKYYLDFKVEGLLFGYVHFYGSYRYIGTSRRWYRNEIRIIRNNVGIYSYKDAQGFRKNGKKVKVAPMNAEIYHYGWVKKPETMQRKMRYFHTLWHSDDWVEKEMGNGAEYDFSGIDRLDEFTGSHPQVMAERIKKSGHTFNYEGSGRQPAGLKQKLLELIEAKTGTRPGEYKGYKLIRK